MGASTEFGLSIYAADLADLEELEKNASTAEIDISSPTRSPQPGNLALDISTVVDMSTYVYKALIFINAAGGTLKLLDWILTRLKNRRDRTGKPIFILDIGGKAYPVGKDSDLQIVKSVIDSSLAKVPK
jgi:hypothetical protein